jgi:uncharacterized DUF497 family protein
VDAHRAEAREGFDDLDKELTAHASIHALVGVSRRGERSVLLAGPLVRSSFARMATPKLADCARARREASHRPHRRRRRRRERAGHRAVTRWTLEERRNIAEHGVSFQEAKSLFTSKIDFIEIYDAEHSDVEERFIAIGPIRRGLVLVAFTERSEDTVRIISARWANKAERALYVEHVEKDT